MAATSSVFQEDGTTLLTFADGRTVRAPSALLYDQNGDPLLTNQASTLLPSAARTTQQVTAVQTNYNARGVLLVLDITVASGTGGLRLGVNVPSVATPADKFTLNTVGGVALQTATGTFGWLVYPGANTTGVNAALLQTVGAAPPRSWSVTVFVGDSSSYTYSLDAYLLL